MEDDRTAHHLFQQPLEIVGIEGFAQHRAAFPLEERAAEAHEANAQRLGEGINNDWVRRSMSQLAKILPARYGKTELVEEVIDDLR